jgi:hypothetical protein
VSLVKLRHYRGPSVVDPLDPAVLGSAGLRPVVHAPTRRRTHGESETVTGARAFNGIIGEGEVMSAETLPRVKMPNRENFILAWPPRSR